MLIAKGLLEVVYEPIDVQVPILKPAEKDWIEKEKMISTKNMTGLVRYGGRSDYRYHQTRYTNAVQGAIVLQYLQGNIQK
jgi:hypothetical protein